MRGDIQVTSIYGQGTTFRVRLPIGPDDKIPFATDQDDAVIMQLDAGTKAYYLNLGEFWMTAPDLIKGPWTESKKTPAEVVKLTPEYEKTEDEEKIIPAVMVVDKSTELITCDGEPKFVPLEGNELLYVSNTDASVLMVLATNVPRIKIVGALRPATM